MSEAPLWRQAFDAVERRVTPPAEQLVRTPGFAVGAALVSRAQATARGAARGLTARAWHLLNLPAGSDVTRLRTQIGALDREVRRLTIQLDSERRSQAAAEDAPQNTRGQQQRRPITEGTHGDDARSAAGDRPGPAGRGTERPAGS